MDRRLPPDPRHVPETVVEAPRRVARPPSPPLHSAAWPEPSEGETAIVGKHRLVIALAANQLLSSGTHLIAKGALTAIGPLPVALLRFTGASLALLAFERLRPRRESIAREDLRTLLLLGFLVVPINQGCFLFGLAYSTPSHAALLYALTPVVVLLMARRLLDERNARRALPGVALAFVGVTIILLDRGLARAAGVLLGDGLLLIAVVAWAAYSVLSKPLLKRYDPMTVTTWVIGIGTVMFLPAAALPGALLPPQSVPLPVWGAILYLAIGTSVIAYPLWLYALRHLEASKVAITTNLQPVLTGILSWLIFREQFTGGFLLGAVLVLAGVTWVEVQGRR